MDVLTGEVVIEQYIPIISVVRSASLNPVPINPTSSLFYNEQEAVDISILEMGAYYFEDNEVIYMKTIIRK